MLTEVQAQCRRGAHGRLSSDRGASHHLEQLLWDGVPVHPGPHPIQGYGVIGQEDVLLKQPIACDLNPVAVTGVW